jgi:ankyrin repeat protein
MTESKSANAQKFLDAVKAGDVAAVRALLDADPNLITARDGVGNSAVLLAIYYGKESVKELLLETGVELDIFEAAATGKSDHVAALLAQDASLANTYAPDGFTPLGLAAFFGRREVVELLLQQGADVNAVSRNVSGYTALTGAVAGGHREIVATLLAHGARADHRYGPGYTPLHEAAASGKLEIARLLLEHGADPNAHTDDGKTPLALAVEKKQEETAALLRQHGATA